MTTTGECPVYPPRINQRLTARLRCVLASNETPVYGDDGARDEGGAVRGEEQCQLRHLFRTPEALDRFQRRQLGAPGRIAAFSIVTSDRNGHIATSKYRSN